MLCKVLSKAGSATLIEFNADVLQATFSGTGVINEGFVCG